MPDDSQPKWIWILVIAVVVAAAVLAWVFIPRTKGFRDVVLDAFDIEDERLLFVNVPPKPLRYPGSILLTWGGYPVMLVAGDDRALERGNPTSLSGTYQELRSGSGEVAAQVFEVVTSAERTVSLEFEISDGRTVEMTVDEIRRRLEARGGEDSTEDLGALTPEDLAKLSVVLRSYEGRLGIRLKRSSSLSEEGWVRLQDELGGAAADVEPRVSLTKTDEETLLVTIEEPVVFAFEAAEAAEFVQNMPRTAWRAPEELQSDPDPSVTIRSLIELDPQRVPDLGRALEEVGPDPARQEIMGLMRQEDTTLRERGEIMLRALPPPVGIEGRDSAELVSSEDPGTRAWAVMKLAEGDSAALPALETALRDDDPSVRYLAAVSLGDLHASAEEVTPVLAVALRDADSVVFRQALATLERFGPGARAAVPEIRALAQEQPTTAKAEMARGALRRIQPR